MNKPATKDGVCLSCRDFRPLSSSHALPHSFFKRVRRVHGQNLVGLSANSELPTIETSESYEEYLLCHECEKFFNEKYDSYGINVLTGTYAKSRRTTVGVTFSEIDRKRFRYFVLSILWRASISTHPAYNGVSIGNEAEEYLLQILRHDKPARSNECTVTLCRLRDTSDMNISLAALRDYIMLPFKRQLNIGDSYIFIASGFLFEIFMNGVPRKWRAKSGVLSGNSKIFLAPYVEAFSIPEVRKTISVSLEKEKH